MTINRSQIWQTEILPNGVHKVILEPRRGFVASLFLFACVSWMLLGFNIFNAVNAFTFSISALLGTLFLFLFSTVSLAGAIHENRSENHFFLSANLLVAETTFFRFKFKKRKIYKDARLKIELSDNGEDHQVMLSMRHNKGHKVIYVADYSADIVTTSQQVECLGQYISEVTGWPLDYSEQARSMRSRM